MKLLKLLSAFLLLIFIASPAEARRRVTVAADGCNVIFPCEGVTVSARGERVVRAMGGFGTARRVYHRRAEPTRQRRAVRVVRAAPTVRSTGGGKSLDGVTPVLAAKVQEIVSTCGSVVWSAVRHTYIAGTRTISQHASGTAVDVHGNPSCIYSMLQGWPGGYSTDYGRVNHVHISHGGREHGLRFAHGGGRRHYARHRHSRYASAHQ